MSGNCARKVEVGDTEEYLQELSSIFDHVPVTHGRREVEVMQMGTADDDYLSFSALDILKRIEEEAADEDRANIPQAAFAFTSFVEPLDPKYIEIAASLICTMVYEHALRLLPQEEKHQEQNNIKLSVDVQEHHEEKVSSLNSNIPNQKAHIGSNTSSNSNKLISRPKTVKSEVAGCEGVNAPLHVAKQDTNNNNNNNNINFEQVSSEWLPTFVISIGNRGAGALAQAVAFHLHLPFSLTNWYPDGSLGEVRVDRCAGIGGPGWVYLNGVPDKSRVLIVLDAVHTGRNALHLIESMTKIKACEVWGVYTVCEVVDGRPRERIRQSLQCAIPLTSIVRVSLGSDTANNKQNNIEFSSNNNNNNNKNNIVDDEVINNKTSYSQVKLLQTESQNDRNSNERENVTMTQQSVSAVHSKCMERQQEHMTNQLLTTSELYRNACSMEDNIIGSHCMLPRRLPQSYYNVIKSMSHEALQRKVEHVMASFVNVPIIVNNKVAYPYCFFALTDFKPALQPELVEDMADLCVYYSSLHECDVLVSEGDRGGGPLLQAISVRTNQPYVIASWTLDETEVKHSPESKNDPMNNDNNTEATINNNSGGNHIANNINTTNQCYSQGNTDTIGVTVNNNIEVSKRSACSAVTSVGFSGSCNRLCLRGLKPNMRCAFVDDMLSSGGTADAVLHCISSLGAIPVEGVFISEKLYPISMTVASSHTTNNNSNSETNHDCDSGKVTESQGDKTCKHTLLRKKQRRLHKMFPLTRITTVVQFVVEGNCTTAPSERVGPFTCTGKTESYLL